MPTAPTIPYELGAFFLTELALVLRWLPPPKMYDPALGEAAESEWSRLRDTIDASVDRAVESTAIGPNFSAYARRVRKVAPTEVS